MARSNRRTFLKLAGAAPFGFGSIARALALPAVRGTGTLNDIQHVVIFMQENRSFDHYFGALRGVRGFCDPRPLRLPGGGSVFHQPMALGSAEVVTPFRLDCRVTSAQSVKSLDHTWKRSHALWRWHDAWIRIKSPLTMGYFIREDVPFHYALADAFTVCDAYHCSVFGPTTPNRMFLFTGTSGLAAGDDGRQAVANPREETNYTADSSKDTPAFHGYGWPTYAERLEQASVSWRVYQEYDNYGDNALAYFASFRGLDPTSPLHRRGRAWVDGSNAENQKSANGDHLVAAFARDVAADSLPSVSWIVAPSFLTEHPAYTPDAGANLSARLIAALTANPAVWAKTAFILNYDENDGYFDHMPPLVPPTGGAPGASTVSLVDELYEGMPFGLGPRVPLIVVSPWTKGGFVNSQLFDHTSVLRLLEARFGVAAEHITPWRRAMTGDLTSVFDFAAGDRTPTVLPDTATYIARAAAQASLPRPQAPSTPGPLPRQEPGFRPARALPYAFDAYAEAASGDGALNLTVVNTGAAGAGFALYPADSDAGGPWYYAVEAGKTLTDRLPLAAKGYDFTLHGPNGFLRRFQGMGADPVSVTHHFDRAGQSLRLTLRNRSARSVEVRVADAYAPAEARARRIAPGAEIAEVWALRATSGWHDITLAAPGWSRRIAGHLETGRPSRSDPALDWTAERRAALL
ncbi:MAG TPA: phospholipase C, phosphocholine-specific [Caulobacteraceae bacterium]